VNLAESEKLIERALSLDPDNGSYLDTLAWVYYQQGKNEQANEYIQKALKHMPNDPTILDHYGDILAKSGKIEDALKIWKQIFKLDPDNKPLRDKLTKHAALPKEEKQ
jgi:tetratricopeptide (TPR) repeat protein